MPEWTFGCDMNGVRPRAIEPPLDVSGHRQREANFRIARHRQRPELPRAEEFQLGAERARFSCDVPQCAYHAVDLRMPCVGGDQDFHAACDSASSATASTSSSVCVQVMISKHPSWCSATAVQLSTQSPQLM